MALAVVLRPADDAQLDSLRAIVREAGLPTEGLEQHFPGAYVVATAGSSLLGVAGLEVHGSDGLLRSVAVRQTFRGEGVGRTLVLDRVDHARSRGLRRVYLLTTTAARYFARLGFRPAERASAPEALAGSKEFASICPQTAACLVWRP